MGDEAEEQVADEEALGALRAASPELQERWEGDDPSKWDGVEWGDGRVRELDLSGCSWKELPAELWLLTGLTYLDLEGCEQLMELPAELGQLVNLDFLYLKNCKQLAALPAELGQLTGLTTLNLQGCEQLTELPAELGQLTGLTTLDLGGCSQLKSRTLPAELGLLVNLTWRPEEQVADEEALRALLAASPALQEGWVKYGAGGEQVRWEGDDPSEWDGVKWGDGRVRELFLQNCPLKELPAQVGLLTGLTKLDLSSCKQLTALPAELGRLTGLTELDLHDCQQLTALPAELGRLTGLTTLNLNPCKQLTALPAELGLLTGLTSLNLVNCTQLTALPAELGRLTGLTSLELGGCEQLTALPAELGRLLNLTYIDLEDCKQLTALPAELGQLVNLAGLNLDGCDQLTLPPGAPADAKESPIAAPTIAAYARLLIVAPRKDTPELLHAFLLATPLAVPPFFKLILTDAVHAVWLGKAVAATPDLARLTDSGGRRAIDVAHSECKQRMQAALYLFGRYDVDDGPLLHRSATSAVAAADDHADPKAKPVRRALKAMQGVQQVRAELQGRAEGLAPEHVVAVRAVYADEGAVDADDKAWQQVQAAAAKLEIGVNTISGLSSAIQAHLFPASKPQESGEPMMAAESSKQDLKRQPSAALAAASSEYKFLIVMDFADRSLKQTIDHEHIAGEDFHSIRAIAAELARALDHLHSKGLIQGDHKPNNAVAFGGDWRLIDLDVSCKIGKPFGNKIPSSGYCPPEMAVVLLTATDDQGKVDGAKLAEYTASEAYDLWSFGTVLYHLIFGRSLWNNDVNDNVTPEDLQTLAAGGETLRKALNKALKKGELRKSPDDLKAAAALLRKLLEPDAKKRLAFFEDFESPMEGVLEEPLFTGKALDAATLEAMNAKLDDLKANQITSHAEVMRELGKIQQSLKTVDTRLMTLTKGDHQVRFRYFVLEPKPPEPGMVAKFKSKVWLTEPMLLIPMYLDENNNLKKAPVNEKALGGHEGFEVVKPKGFVQAHSQLIKASLFVLKIALTAAAAQVGARIPQFNVDFSGGSTIGTMLEETMNQTIADGFTSATSEAVGSLEAPEDGLEKLLTPADGEAGHALTNDKYTSLASWLDGKHPEWKDNLGLTTEPQDDGTLKIVPAAVTPAASLSSPVDAGVGSATQAPAPTQLQEASPTAGPALVQVDVENERLKKENAELKKEIAEQARTAPAPRSSCCVIG